MKFNRHQVQNGDNENTEGITAEYQGIKSIYEQYAVYFRKELENVRTNVEKIRKFICRDTN